MQRATRSRHMQSTSRESSRKRRSRQPKHGEKTVGWSLTTPAPPLLGLDIPGNEWMLHIVHFLMKFCPFFSSVVFSSDFHRLCLHEIFCCCRMRKRSISPMQGEQGADDAQITDGWSHYSYPDTTGTKKMKTDGVWIRVFICTVFVLFFSLFGSMQQGSPRKVLSRGWEQVAWWMIITAKELKLSKPGYSSARWV